MATIPLILIVLAVVVLGLEAFKLAPETPHIKWGWAGLFLMAAVQLFYGTAALFK